jgi:hypothetical protein
MELLDICLTTTYFQVEDKFCQQKEGMTKIALHTADHKPAKWLKYFDNTFVIWSCGPARLQKFLHHFNSLRPTMKYTIKVEANYTLLFLDVLIIERVPKLATKVCQKSTHTGRYLNFRSSHPHYVKRGVVRSLISHTRVSQMKPVKHENSKYHAIVL